MKTTLLLQTLGFSDKQTQVYLCLLGVGIAPASTIAKRLSMSRSTALFILDELSAKGVVRKTKKGEVGYFTVEPEDIERVYLEQAERQKVAVENIMPLLNKLRVSSETLPKLLFFEGIDGCRRAYLQLLESTSEILEFGVHDDLAAEMGEDFMDDFIAQRVKKGISLRAIGQRSHIEEQLRSMDQEQLRQIRWFEVPDLKLYSSIALFDNKVLLLNLYQSPFAIIIENAFVAQTIRTLFSLLWEGTSIT